MFTSEGLIWCCFSQVGHVLLHKTVQLSKQRTQPLCKWNRETNRSCEILLRWQKAHDMSEPVAQLKIKPQCNFLSQHSAWHEHQAAGADALRLQRSPNRKLLSPYQQTVTGANSIWQQVHSYNHVSASDMWSTLLRSQARSCHGAALSALECLQSSPLCFW